LEPTGNNGWKLVRHEKLGMYDCRVWKRVAGSSTTYEWWDDGLKRQTVVVGHRPIKVKMDRSERMYCRYRSQRLELDDMTHISAMRLGKRKFDFGISDSMFSGILMDSDAYVKCDGEEVYLARTWC
jgi:hypothetical protein